jgi:EAL domain-containing protein (putative c-di-GMP-specific phosphodiesterase class I)
VDALGLDASLARDIHIQDSGRAVVRAALAMARSLRLGTVAEGVEHDAQRDFLVQEACEALQGCLFGRPMPLDRLADVVHST